jgi:hypothetical protein
MSDYTDDLLDGFDFPDQKELIPQKKMVLQILDYRGHTEDVIVDIEEIYKIVKKAYESYPEGN